MSNLSGKTITSSFDQLLITTDNSGVPGSDASATSITTGAADAQTPLWLSTNRVGINVTPSSATLMIKDNNALGTSINNQVLLSEYDCNSNTHRTKLRTWILRNASGTGWDKLTVVDGISIDGSYGTAITSKTWMKRKPWSDGIFSWGSQSTEYLQLDVTGLAIHAAGVASAHSIDVFTGDISIRAGNLNVASGYGIDFSAHDPAAGAGIHSTDDEVLHDYEEGYFHCGLSDESGNNFTMVSNYDGFYTKIGDRIFCVGYAQWNSKGSAVDADMVRLHGFPYTVVDSNLASRGNLSFFNIDGVTWTGVDASSNAQFVGRMSANTDRAIFNVNRSGSSSTQQICLNMGGSGNIGWSVSYETAD